MNFAKRPLPLGGEAWRFLLSNALNFSDGYVILLSMKLVAQLKLKPTAAQHTLLKATLERANAACNAISAHAWKHQVFNQYAIHDALYYTLRRQFALSAQLVVRCLSKVADAYKTDKTTWCHFKEHGSIAYDARLLRYETDKQQVSIWMLPGREAIPYQCGERQKDLLTHQQGESDLMYHGGEWYLLATCEVEEPTPEQVEHWLGVDRGIVNLAVDSDGQVYQGDLVEARR